MVVNHKAQRGPGSRCDSWSIMLTAPPAGPARCGGGAGRSVSGMRLMFGVRDRVWGVLALGTVAAGLIAPPQALAQDAPPIGPAPETAAAPAANPDAPPNPYQSLPDILNPVPLDQLVQSLNTPSGLPFLTQSGPPQRGFHYTLTEALRFDDNVLRLLPGAAAAPGRSRSDLYSATNFSASYAMQWGLQNVFIKGDLGLTRYRTNTDLNSTRYALAAGINWRLGYPCAGNITATTRRSEVETQDLLVGARPSLTDVISIDGRGRCHIIDRLYGTFGAGASQNSFSTNSQNDYRRYNASVGLEYAVPKFYTLGIQITRSRTDYFNRDTTIPSLLAASVAQTEYSAYYNYTISPKTRLDFSGGIIQSSASSPFFSRSRTSPTFSAGISWRPTPKILVNARVQRSVSPPQGIAADYQRTDIASLSLTYSYSRKLSFSAAYLWSRSSFSAGGVPGGLVAGNASRTNTYSLDANYRISPFWFTTLGYRHTEQADKVTGQSRKSNLYTVSLSYRR